MTEGPEPRLLSRETAQKSAFPKTQDPPETT